MCRWGARWLWAGWGPVGSCGVAGLGAVGERVACVCLDPHGCRCGPHPPPARTQVAEALRERAQRVYEQYGTVMVTLEGMSQVGAGCLGGEVRCSAAGGAVVWWSV